MLTLKYAPADSATLKADGEEMGGLTALFSTFDIEDRSGDIVRRSALEDYQGTEVGLVWSHQWDKIIGKGTLDIETTGALFKGGFFLDTAEGLDKYKTVKNMGAIQQYSWGFRVLEALPLDDEEDDYWFWGPIEIIKAEPFEVSPVLIGANQQTRTIEVKGADGVTQFVERKIAKSLLTPRPRQIVVDAKTTQIMKQATQPGGALPLAVGVTWDGLDVTGVKDFPFNQEIYTNLGVMKIVQTTTSSTTTPEGMRFSEETEAVLAAAQKCLERARDIREKRAENGRDLSAERLEQLAEIGVTLREIADQYTTLTAVTEEEESEPEADALDRDRARERRLAVAKRKRIQLGME